MRGVGLHLLDLGGDVANGLSKLFFTIASAFAEAERDRIRERVSQSKADARKRGMFLGGRRPFGWEKGELGELVPVEAEQAAIGKIVAMRKRKMPLRAISAAITKGGVSISHEGVSKVLKAQAAEGRAHG